MGNQLRLSLHPLTHGVPEVKLILEQIYTNNHMTAELADGSMVLNLDGYQTTSDFFILDNSHHPYTRPFDGYPNIPQIGDTCDRLIVCDGTPIVSLAGYYENDVPNWIYFPFYFAQANFQNPSDINYSKTSEKFNSISKTHRFSCLNRNPKN